MPIELPADSPLTPSGYSALVVDYVRSAVTAVAGRQAHISAPSQEDWNRFEVRDLLQGVSEEDRRKLTTALTRAQTSGRAPPVMWEFRWAGMLAAAAAPLGLDTSALVSALSARSRHSRLSEGRWR